MTNVKTQAMWTLDKKVTIGGIVSLLVLSGSILSVYVSMNVRMSNAELALVYQKGVNDQLRDNLKENKTDTAAGFSEVKSSIRDLTGKVDRLLERK